MPKIGNNKKTAARWLRVKSRRWVRKIFHQQGSPRSIALGVAIGMFVSMTPTIPFHVVAILVICMAVGANPIAGMAQIVWTNPLTMVPIFLFEYKLGCALRSIFFGGGQPEVLRGALGRIASAGDVGEKFKYILELGHEVIVPLLVGSIIVGFVCALVSYPLALRFVRIFRKRIERKRRLRLERIESYIKGLIDLAHRRGRDGGSHNRGEE